MIPPYKGLKDFIQRNTLAEESGKAEGRGQKAKGKGKRQKAKGKRQKLSADG
jgi:hypothetical protein